MDNWLTELKTRIVDAKDSKNFDDIIKCYQNNLLRAGFLMAWLMLIESFKRKIVELADKGVKIAISELNTITTVENAMHSNDEVIWKGALKCELISKEDDNVLDMLWKKRCVMSHPYMPEVCESDFRYMVEKLISMALSKTLMWSKIMIKDYFEDIKNNTFLIPDEYEEKNEEVGRVLALVPEGLRTFFWKTLFYELSLSLDSGKKKHQMMLRMLAIRFVQLEGVDINDVGYTIANQIKNHCDVCWNVFFDKITWCKLNEEYQAQLFRYLKDDKMGAKKVLGLVQRLLAYENNIDDKFVDCYYEALAHFDVTDMQGYYIDKKRFLKRLYEEKIKDCQFYDQADFIDMLLSMKEGDLDEFTDAQLQEIGKYVEICCVNGTFKARDFVGARNIWTENLNFAIGFAVEGLTNEIGNLYVSPRHLVYVMSVLNLIKKEKKIQVIAALEEIPVGESIKETTLCNNIRIEVKKYLDGDYEVEEAMQAVINKYCLG